MTTNPHADELHRQAVDFLREHLKIHGDLALALAATAFVFDADPTTTLRDMRVRPDDGPPDLYAEHIPLAARVLQVLDDLPISEYAADQIRAAVVAAPKESP